jgi:hypothetical protein
MNMAGRRIAATAGAGGATGALMELLGSSHLSPWLTAGALAMLAMVVLTATGVVASVVLTAGLAQRVVLGVGTLLAGRNPGIGP